MPTDSDKRTLADDLGGESIVSLILKGKRQLNRQQMEKLSHRFHVSPAVFSKVIQSASKAKVRAFRALQLSSHWRRGHLRRRASRTSSNADR